MTTRFRPFLPVVLDDDAGARCEIGADVGVHATDVRDGRRHPVFNETPGEGPAFDKEFDVERPRENAMQGPDDQLVLTDGQRTHNASLYRSRTGLWSVVRTPGVWRSLGSCIVQQIEGIVWSLQGQGSLKSPSALITRLALTLEYSV